MKYEIKNAEWGDMNHTWLNIKAKSIDEFNDNEEKEFYYIARESDSAPVNKILWELVMRNPESILENETKLILEGKIPLPKGKTIIGERILDDETQAESIRKAVKDQLAILTTPESIAKAELDLEYAQHRKEVMKSLLDIEKQEGFPYNVEWPEVS